MSSGFVFSSGLVAALDRDGDGFIDYDEFLAALEASDVLEQ